MALKATVYKADLQIADMDRAYYADHALTLARHPSETEERMMVRLIAFALYAHERLDFAKGMCVNDEPDLWQKDLTGAIERWIDVGLPDEKWLRKACGRAAHVVVISYGGRSADIWWEQNQAKLGKLANLSVSNLALEASKGLAAMARRTMRLQCSVQDGQVWLTDGELTVPIDLRSVKASS